MTAKTQSSAAAFDFLVESNANMKPIVAKLEPLARQTFDEHDKIVRDF